jgi:hypothetical protein
MRILFDQFLQGGKDATAQATPARTADWEKRLRVLFVQFLQGSKDATAKLT